MKKLFIILSCLFCSITHGQIIQYLGSPTTQIYVRGQLRVDSVIYLPQRDTNFIPAQAGAIVTRSANNQAYLWNGTRWNILATGSTVWGTITGTLTDQTDLVTALNAKQNTITPGYGLKFTGATLLIDTANFRKVDTLFRVNDSTISYKINGHTYTFNIRGSPSGVSAITLNTDNVIFSTPVNFTGVSGAWTGSLALKNQSPNTFFSGPASGGAASPTFRVLAVADLPTGIPNANLLNSSIGLVLGTSGSDANVSGSPASLGNNLILNLPSASGSNRGLLTTTDWSRFNTKVDSIKRAPGNDSVFYWVNATKVFAFLDSAGGGGGGGTVTSFAFTNGGGFTGSVSNATSTPTLSLQPSFTGLVSSNGTAFLATTVGNGLTYSGTTLKVDTSAALTNPATQAYVLSHGGVTDTTSLSKRINWKQRVYNVVMYGADSSGATDATAAIQSAINACDAAGGGIVYFPNGRYKIAGALDVAHGNSQLYIPYHNPVSTTAVCSITLLGESINSIPGGGYQAASISALPTTGVILKSTITGSGTEPSVIGMYNPSGNFNFTDIHVENMYIQLYTNHATQAVSMSAFDFHYASKVHGYKLMVSSDTTNQVSLNPGVNETAGILCSNFLDGGPNVLQECIVMGTKYGYIIGEHSQIVNCQGIANVYNLTLPKGAAEITGHFLSQASNYDIFVPGTTIFTNYTTGNVFINITLAIEEDYPGKWYDNVGDIKDSLNNLRGYIKYIANDSAGAITHLLVNQGALFVDLQDMNGSYYRSIQKLKSPGGTLSGVQITATDAAQYAVMQMFNDLGGNGAQILYPGSTSALGATYQSTLGFFNTVSGKGFLFGSVNSPQLLVLADNGNVNLGKTDAKFGVGTVPGAALHVAGTTATVEARLQNTNSGGSAIGAYTLINDVGNQLQIGKLGGSYSSSGLFVPSAAFLYNTVGPMFFAANSNVIDFSHNIGSTSDLRIASSGNVLIGTTTDVASSILTVNSTLKGILSPRMNTTQQNAISSPATGLLIFNTDSALFRFWNGSSWQSIAAGASGANFNLKVDSINRSHDTAYYYANGSRFFGFDSVGKAGLPPLTTNQVAVGSGNLLASSSLLTYSSSRLNITQTSAGGYGGIDFTNNGILLGQFLAAGRAFASGGVNDSSLALASEDGDLNLMAGNTGSKLKFFAGGLATTDQVMLIAANHKVGIQSKAPTAYLQLGAGVASTNNAPFKFTTSGAALLATPEAGAMEVLADSLYWTGASGTRYKIYPGSGSGSGSNLISSNGITAVNDSTIALGGTFNQNTTISGSNLYAFKLDSLTSFTVNGIKTGSSLDNIITKNADSTFRQITITALGNALKFTVNELSSGTVSLGTPGGYFVATGTTSTWTLPGLSGSQGSIFHIKNAGSGNVTLQRSGSDNIYNTSSVTSITIAAGAFAVIVAGPSFFYVE